MAHLEDALGIYPNDKFKLSRFLFPTISRINYNDTAWDIGHLKPVAKSAAILADVVTPVLGMLLTADLLLNNSAGGFLGLPLTHNPVNIAEATAFLVVGKPIMNLVKSNSVDNPMYNYNRRMAKKK